MSEAAYRQAMTMLKQNGLSVVPVKRPSSQDVMPFGTEIDVRLPLSYRPMLLDIGLFQVSSLEFAGLGNSGLDGRTGSSVVFSTEQYRADGLISDSLIQIGVTGHGPFYLIDYAQIDHDGEAPVWEAPGNGVRHGKDDCR